MSEMLNVNSRLTTLILASEEERKERRERK